MPTRYTPEEGNVGITRGNLGACVSGVRLRESLERDQDFIQQPMNTIPELQEEAFETLIHQEVNELLQECDDDKCDNEVALILADKFEIALPALVNTSDPTTYKDLYEPPRSMAARTLA
jgi:hypothetical protein